METPFTIPPPCTTSTANSSRIRFPGISRRDFSKRQHLSAVLPHELDGLASLLNASMPPDIAVDALRALPSYGQHEFIIPAKPNPRFKGNFKRPHAWDLWKRFRRVAKLAGVKVLRIQDLRHFAASTS
jgi:hypothetical protein